MTVRQQLQFCVATALIVSVPFYCFFALLGAAGFYSNAHILALPPAALVLVVGLIVSRLAWGLRLGVIAASASSAIGVLIGLFIGPTTAIASEALIRNVMALRLGLNNQEKTWLAIRGLDEFTSAVSLLVWLVVSVLLAYSTLRLIAWIDRASKSANNSAYGADRDVPR